MKFKEGELKIARYTDQFRAYLLQESYSEYSVNTLFKVVRDSTTWAGEVELLDGDRKVRVLKDNLKIEELKKTDFVELKLKPTENGYSSIFVRNLATFDTQTKTRYIVLMEWVVDGVVKNNVLFPTKGELDVLLRANGLGLEVTLKLLSAQEAP